MDICRRRSYWIVVHSHTSRRRIFPLYEVWGSPKGVLVGVGVERGSLPPGLPSPVNQRLIRRKSLLSILNILILFLIGKDSKSWLGTKFLILRSQTSGKMAHYKKTHLKWVISCLSSPLWYNPCYISACVRRPWGYGIRRSVFHVLKTHFYATDTWYFPFLS